jgi:hypothetical protein
MEDNSGFVIRAQFWRNCRVNKQLPEEHSVEPAPENGKQRFGRPQSASLIAVR